MTSQPSAPPPPPPPPPFSSSLPEIEPLPRPRLVPVAVLLVVIAAGLHLWVTATGLADSSRIRAELTKQLGKEAVDFNIADVKHAVNVLFAVANGLGVLLLALIALNVNSLLSRRTSGRTGLTVVSLIFIPVAGMNFLLRLGEGRDLALTTGTVGCLLLALGLLFLGPVSRWLHQLERTHRIPMDPTARGAQATD